MTRDKTLFSTFFSGEGGIFSYGDNNKGKIIGFGMISKSPNPMIGEVLLVKALKHNILSISQLCEKGNNATFDSSGCRVIKSKSNKTLFTSSRSVNTYIVDLNKSTSNYVSLLTNKDGYWLCHGRIAHIHTDHLNKLVCKDCVDDLPYLHFENNIL